MTVEIDERVMAAMIDDEAWPAVAPALQFSRGPRDAWLRTLAFNLDALRTHRPMLYAQVRDAIDSGSVGRAGPIARDRSADLSINAAFEQVDGCRQAGLSVAIIGIGDGSLVRAMAKFAPPLAFERQQEIVVVEPDLDRLVAALGCCDLTSVFEQRRIAIYAGDDWAATFCAELLAQPTRMYPQAFCPGGEARPELEAAFESIADDVRAAQVERRRANAAHYAAASDADLVAALGPNPPRPPRALLVTSRFTAVLQHSTADSADALRKLGWDARVLIEPEPWHCVAPPGVEAAIADFRPDVVFQIDHLRYEHGETIPPQLPFVCWVQDHLANLTSPLAGASIGERDFVLTGGVYRYVDRHGYPRRQCVDMAKVSREPLRPTKWDEDAEDILYVSHWSQPPEQMLAEAAARIGEATNAPTLRLFHACAAEVASIYAGGGAIRLDVELRDIVRRFGRRDACEVSPSVEQFLVDQLFQRLNNAYYRQQALTWAGEVADARGLRFGLYGNGWDKHATLGKYARGTVRYGAELESLTRRSKILLQLEPYPCFSHQRMLDAVLAGGFVLARSHPMNTLATKIRAFLDAHLPASVHTVAAARRAMPAHAVEAFESLLVESRMFDAMGDVVDVIRGWHRAGVIGDDDAAMPHLAEIEFDDRATLAARVDRFLDDREARRRIGEAQRDCIAGRLTYVSALGRAMKRIHALLAESTIITTTQREAA